MSERAARIRLVGSIADVDAAAWDALDHGGSPFLRHGFLRALEESGSVGPEAGWVPRYLLLDADGPPGAADGLRGALAAFVKDNSNGEFIFDWDWAHASERAGIRYYPKLVVAAPFSPATGPRLLLAGGLDAAARREVATTLVAAAGQVATDEGCSSLHFLFVTAEEVGLLTELGLAPRASYQFHWRHRGEATFDEFLARMTSRRRKQARKERERARAAVDAIELVPGGALGARDLADLDRFYRTNVELHMGQPYLEPGFFDLLARYLPDQMLVARAVRGGRSVAGALYLETEQALYGRYWGADEPIPTLHFELTCWLAIERCIERGTPRYEAGAQGQHKLLRGLEPAATHSAHHLRHPAVDQAIRRYLALEAPAVAERMAHLAAFGPFKQPDDPG